MMRLANAACHILTRPGTVAGSVQNLCWSISIWVCLKIGYIPNYNHLIGIMIINHWV